ncbi:MAG: hypothetical protein WDO15_21755 [Bacteroidota bacterium]
MGNITLAVDNGSFLRSVNPKQLVLEMGATKTATFTVKASTASEPLTITAQLAGTSFNVYKTVKLNEVLPDKILIEPAAYEIAASGSVTVNAFLTCTTGKPSDGIEVAFMAVQDQGGGDVEVGTFKDYPFVSDGSQKVSATFSIDTRKPLANIPITISAKVVKKESINSTIDVIAQP